MFSDLVAGAQDENGDYTLYPLVGTTVYPDVSMEGHDFQPWSIGAGREVAKYFRGLKISQKGAGSGSFRNHNFVDTTLADLIVEIAGGACNIDLGESEVEVSVNGCSQDTYAQQFTQNK